MPFGLADNGPRVVDSRGTRVTGSDLDAHGASATPRALSTALLHQRTSADDHLVRPCRAERSFIRNRFRTASAISSRSGWPAPGTSGPPGAGAPGSPLKQSDTALLLPKTTNLNRHAGARQPALRDGSDVGDCRRLAAARLSIGVDQSSSPVRTRLFPVPGMRWSSGVMTAVLRMRKITKPGRCRGTRRHRQ
jgi:hypothetical protein